MAAAAYSQYVLRTHTITTDARQNASVEKFQLTSVKLEIAEQQNDSIDRLHHNEADEVTHIMKEEEQPCLSSDFIVKQNNVKEENDETDKEQEDEQEEREEMVDSKRGQKRRYNSSKYCARNMSLSFLHRCHLDELLNNLVREHRWKEAAGVLSVLLKGAPAPSNMFDDGERRYYMAAMELHRRSFSKRDGTKYEMWIRQVFEVWMNNLPQLKSCPEKKNKILLELAVFYFTQRNVDAAYSTMKLVIQDHVMANKASVNLLYGMILYQLWYSDLPEDYKIKDFNYFGIIKSFGHGYANDYQETSMENCSNDHYAAVNDNTNLSSRSISISLFRDRNATLDYIRITPRKEAYIASPQEYSMSHSIDSVKKKLDDLQNLSVFYAQGLDTGLLPICLDHLNGDVDINQYRMLADKESYIDAVKYLKLALHSSKPESAALLPLIQLLLLGDRVDEAFAEVESSCQTFDISLPFRLMARLLECFQPYKVSQICSYYENALERDPICYQSLERLVQMHKLGNCSTMLMFKMITFHLDASDGNCAIWEEFSSCLVKIQNPPDVEECNVKNQQKRRKKALPSIRIPEALLSEVSRSSWKLRLKWWKRRHFSISSLPDNAIGDDHKLLCFKAACASHFYGTKFEYVARVLGILQDDHVTILKNHMRNSINLFGHSNLALQSGFEKLPA